MDILSFKRTPTHYLQPHNFMSSIDIPFDLEMTPFKVSKGQLTNTKMANQSQKPELIMKSYSMSSSMKNGKLQHIEEEGLHINSNKDTYSYMTNDDGKINVKKGKLSEVVKKPSKMMNLEDIQQAIVKKSKKSKKSNKTKTKSKSKSKSNRKRKQTRRNKKK